MRTHVVVTGGAAAGVHDARVPEAGCSSYPGDSALLIAMDQPMPGGRTSTLVVFETAQREAARAGTSRFFLDFSVPGTAGPTELVIDSTRGGGRGTATVSGEFPLWVVRVRGTTVDGTGVDVTFTCERTDEEARSGGG